MSALESSEELGAPAEQCNSEGEDSPSSCFQCAQDIHIQNVPFPVLIGSHIGRVPMMRWSLGASGAVVRVSDIKVTKSNRLIKGRYK